MDLWVDAQQPFVERAVPQSFFAFIDGPELGKDLVRLPAF